jgi:uncharacterized membrane protein
MQAGEGLAETNWFDALLHSISLFIEAAGIAVIVLGAAAAVLIALAQLGRGGAGSEAYHSLRTNLARSILLGLELLVAADIIGTVAVEPTLQNLYVLALIVLIRTFLSISLEVEIDGRWPWQRARPTEDTPPAA